MGRKERSVRRSVFLAVACAGCATYLSVEESTGKADLTGESLKRVPWNVNGKLGMSVAALSFRYPEDRDQLEDGVYYDIRYRYELSRHWGVEASVGYFHSDSKPVFIDPPGVYVDIFDDVDCVPVRLTFTLGSESRNYPVSWFVGGGGGYLIYGSEHETETRPVDNEWATHVQVGIEIKPTRHLEFPICTRLNAGYLWPGESEKDLYLLGVTLFFGF